MDDLLLTATTTYASTTGFSFDTLMQYATSSVLHLFVGLGLSVLEFLTGWILAALIIGAIILFALTALYFFRQ